MPQQPKTISRIIKVQMSMLQPHPHLLSSYPQPFWHWFPHPQLQIKEIKIMYQSVSQLELQPHPDPKKFISVSSCIKFIMYRFIFCISSKCVFRVLGIPKISLCKNQKSVNKLKKFLISLTFFKNMLLYNI